LQKSTIKQEAIQITSMTPPISFLSETSVDNFLSNKTQAKQYADIITSFLHKFDSIIQLQKINVTPMYCEIAYDVEKQDIINDIFSAQSEILEELKVDFFNILYKNNTIRFEILNNAPSKISLKSIYSLLKKVEFNNAIVGVDENSVPLLINIVKKPNMLLVGTYGSGVSMLMTTLLISLAYSNNPKDLGMVILSPNNDKVLKHLCLLPHLIYPIKNEQHDITKTLIDLQNEINNRELLFKKSKSRSLNEYNSSQRNDIDYLKRIVISIFNFNIISKISIQNRDLIVDIIKRGSRVGISVILLSNNVDSEVLNQEIYKELDTKLFMKLEFEQESIQLLNSKRGIELFGNGDGYYFDSESKQHTRFQACYMNIEELIQVIKIIETFYSVKSKLN
jgi:S-DNA-T family DNA segregation ATPase FtsK/SpoIIIE